MKQRPLLPSLLPSGLSQEELSEKCGLHRTYIGGIESLGRNVSLVNIERIAKALKRASSDMLILRKG
ncbi:MAG: helix-turn-helix transcriptional regulator [Candidatus Omnitrophica bacterium]|nr:helix-turn-helix transcriptional regulator [Candidatus Omnitrophota bacterium]